MKILIIEDDRATACMLKEFLDSQHEVLVAYTGNDAITTSLDFKPQLIISDWNLKDEVDGVTACKRITESCKPILIFVSGSPIEQLRSVAEALSPLHILSKPLDLVSFSALVEKIGEGCKKAHLDRQESEDHH